MKKFFKVAGILTVGIVLGVVGVKYGPELLEEASDLVNKKSE